MHVVLTLKQEVMCPDGSISRFVGGDLNMLQAFPNVDTPTLYVIGSMWIQPQDVMTAAYFPDATKYPANAVLIKE